MNQFMLKMVMTTIAITCLAGCTFYRVDGDEIAYFAKHPKGNQKDIKYLETVTVPYEVIGTVEVSTERRNSIEEVVEKMQRQIAVLGGDAVTNIVQRDEPSPITKIRTKYVGTVIILKDENLK